jgi:CRISPR-associated protein Cas5t
VTGLLWLRLRAPFAAFRWLQAGVYRATSPVIPPSAAWGLVLNLAGIETRAALNTPVTGTRADLPSLGLAIGRVLRPEVATLYQQLHGYPVGSSSKELQAGTHGAKYHIAPVRRELLVDFDCVLGVRGDEAILGRAERGLRGEWHDQRYGLPFAGDNNLLFDRIDRIDGPSAADWVVPGAGASMSESFRLTVKIDRADTARTDTRLYAFEHAAAPPEHAWTWTPTEP